MIIVLYFPFRAITKDNVKVYNKKGQFFLPARYKRFEKQCRKLAKECYFGKPLEGDLHVSLTFYFKNKVRPDLFNLPKSICDAMNGILYEDDRQIVSGSLSCVVSPTERICMIVSNIL